MYVVVPVHVVALQSRRYAFGRANRQDVERELRIKSLGGLTPQAAARVRRFLDGARQRACSALGKAECLPSEGPSVFEGGWDAPRA